MKKLPSILLVLCIILTLFAPVSAAQGVISAPEEEPAEETAGVEEYYEANGTIYDFENEIDIPLASDPAPPPEDDDEGDADEDIYDSLSYDSENASQLDGAYVIDEIIIKFKEPGDVPGKEKQLQVEIGKVLKIGFVEEIGAYVAKAGDLDINPNEILNRYKNNKYVEYVEPNYIMQCGYVPNEPNYRRYLYALANAVNAPAGWDIIKGGGPVIAVIDTGVANHTDLPPSVSGYSAIPGFSPYNDKIGHGTNVAGTIAAIGDNGAGTAGINWNAEIMSIKVDDANGAISVASVAKGITWAVDNGAKVLNLSLGTTSDSITLRKAIDYAFDNGCAIFAATGNAGEGTIDYPARYPNVMAVGASPDGAERQDYSNYGEGMGAAAPGMYYATLASGGYGVVAGTSFSSPLAAGLASLIWAVNPDLPNVQVYELIRNGASGKGDYIDNELGYGLIDMGRTLELAMATLSGYDGQDAGGINLLPETSQESRVPPVIKLAGFTNLTLDYGQPYREMGYTATDCKQSDLTAEVKVISNVNIWKAGLYTISYTVADSSGKTARASRTVAVKPKPADPLVVAAPKITIIGSDPIILHRDSGTPYTEQMARAIDYDGTDISHLVKIYAGHVNRNIAGTYTLTYIITSPKTGLAATATREVRILAPGETRGPRTKYGFSGQAKTGAKITHTGILSGSLGFIDLTLLSIDMHMKITVQLYDTEMDKAVLTDTFSAAGSKQYKIDTGKYDLIVSVTEANGNSKYSIELLMPETAPTVFYEEDEIPLPGIPQIAPIGSNPIILHLGGSPYIEQGARALDYLGNDITETVLIEGAPDTGTPGVYTVTYIVYSIYGFPVAAHREVRILAPDEYGVYEEAEIPLAQPYGTDVLSGMEDSAGTNALSGTDGPSGTDAAADVNAMNGAVLYTVVKGDSLWKISRRFYGTGKRWGEIYELNKKLIGRDPDRLMIGWTLFIKPD